LAHWTAVSTTNRGLRQLRAVWTVGPLRYAHRPEPDEDLVRYVNLDCATRASSALLNLNTARTDSDFIRRIHRATLGPIELSCLTPYLENFDKIVFASDYRGQETFDDIENAMPFGPYNTIELRGRQMIQIENLINIYLAMKYAKGEMGSLFPTD
jgi:hypothetical protein